MYLYAIQLKVGYVFSCNVLLQMWLIIVWLYESSYIDVNDIFLYLRVWNIIDFNKTKCIIYYFILHINLCPLTIGDIKMLKITKNTNKIILKNVKDELFWCRLQRVAVSDHWVIYFKKHPLVIMDRYICQMVELNSELQQQCKLNVYNRRV